MAGNGSAIGCRFGNYRVTEPLGQGGMGTVYRARDEALERDVALKVMDLGSAADARQSERFWREARLVARLDHPNIVSVYATGRQDSWLYLAMELVDGQSLRQLVRQSTGGLGVERALEIAEQVLQALQAAHQQGVVHRDVKPENILIRGDGTVKVLDFGVAKLQGGPALTRVDEVLGTVEYMAPEQILGEPVGPAADLYATGAVLYELLTGVRPFSGETPAALVYRQLNEDPVPPSSLRPGLVSALDQLVLGLLDKLPESRCPSAGAALVALEEARQRHQLARLGAVAVPGTGAPSAASVRAGFVPRFTGRQSELETLTAHFDSARSGGRVVFVAGEAGIGKTRLVEQLARHVADSGGCVARGSCFFEHALGPFMPFLEAVARLFGDGTGELTRQEREALRQSLPAQVPELADLVLRERTTGRIRVAFTASLGAEENAPAARQRLFDAVFDLLAAVAGVRPLVLLLEDLHWADEGSLQLLNYLVRRAPEAPLFCVATYRPEELVAAEDEVHPLAAMLQQLHSEGLLHQVRPGRLRREDLMRLAASLFVDADFGPDFVDFLYEQSQGNPLVAVEVLKLLCDQGVVYCQDGVWTVRADLAQVELPERIGALVMRRVNRLDDEHRELLQMAAVVGPRFTSEVLEGVAGVPRLDLLKALFRLERRFRLVTASAGQFEFCHSTVREAVYAETPWELRREYHRLVAGVLEARLQAGHPVDSEEVSTHLFRAEEFGRALPHLLTSADQAFRLFDWRRAAQLYGQAAEACRQSSGPPEQYLHAQRYSAVSLIYLTAYERALEWLEEMRQTAQETGHRQEQAEAWKLISKVHEQQRHFPRATEALSQALLCLEGLDAPFVRGRILINWGCVDFECGRYDAAVSHWREALELVKDVHPEEHALALNNLAVVATVRGDLEQAWQLYSQALALYETCQASPQVTLTYYNMGMVRADQERWDEALELYERSLQICRATRNRFQEPAIEVNRAEALLGKGNLVEARQACSRALRGFRRLEDGLGVADALRLYGRLCRLERNWEEGRGYLEQSVDLNRRYGESVSLGEALWELGLVHRGEGSEARALEVLREAEGIFARAGAQADLQRVRAAIAEVAALAAA
ncbi:MAG: protein kinase [Candidatus Latescibacterota bacterium]